jgi:hypothetical protein
MCNIAMECIAVCNNVFNLCNETNVTHFSFILLGINGLYIFRALLTHPQDSLHKRYLVYCMRMYYTH